MAACSCTASESDRPLEPTPPPAVEFSLFGSAVDTAFRPLADVRVEVIEGPRAGVSAAKDSSGRYELPGVSSDAIVVHASKDS